MTTWVMNASRRVRGVGGMATHETNEEGTSMSMCEFDVEALPDALHGRQSGKYPDQPPTQFKGFDEMASRNGDNG